MPWYGREFYTDEHVLTMTLEQEGAYFRLLWNCWQEGSIPADTAKLAAICKNTSVHRFEETIWPALSVCFVSTSDGRLMHGKVESLRAAKEQRRTTWSEAGKRGNAKRWSGNRVNSDQLGRDEVHRFCPNTTDLNGTGSSDHVDPIDNSGNLDRVPDRQAITQRPKPDRVSVSVDCRLPITYNTPPTPSCEGAGALLDIDDPPFSTTERDGQFLASSDAAIQRVAASIHTRHPSARRDCSVVQVERKLKAILRHRHVPASEQQAYLDRIDQNHASRCASDDWQKDGGQFAKSLENWLAPTMERYDVVPTCSAPASEPPRLIL